jgi:hypothetical protein
MSDRGYWDERNYQGRLQDPVPLDWESGDPLFMHPHHREGDDGQVPRAMFQLTADGCDGFYIEAASEWWCGVCEVGWAKDALCFVCEGANGMPTSYNFRQKKMEKAWHDALDAPFEG